MSAARSTGIVPRSRGSGLAAASAPAKSSAASSPPFATQKTPRSEGTPWTAPRQIRPRLDSVSRNAASLSSSM
jgi:hypothetical protein